jgi:polyferredoxin
VQEIEPQHVRLSLAGGREERLANDVVFALIGREAPLEFFRKSGVPIRGEYTARNWIAFALILCAAVFVYHWKKTGVYFGIGELFQRHGWFPYGVPAWWASLGGAFADKRTLLGTLKITLGEPGFYYSLAYCVVVALFGWQRVRRRRTPYVRLQTLTLAAVQIVPLFLLPYVILPWMGNNGLFDGGALGRFADSFFPRADYGHGREYWRAFGFVLAWPLFFWNVFTEQPLWGWLVLSLVQTFVLIPLIVWKWGKGAYCGWICSCGALAETLGDTQRTKMPHGPRWNRLDMLGQVFLALAFVLLLARSLSWAFPHSVFGGVFEFVFKQAPVFNYVWFVDLLWAGILGVGCYWHFSGRVWCRFACPLAALMHVYARFSRFRILAEKKKCISCNVCTSVCHQGIDVMSFANKGLPMADPECVRCSACVSSCPTGVLAFGEVDPASGRELRRDRLAASALQLSEPR